MATYFVSRSLPRPFPKGKAPTHVGRPGFSRWCGEAVGLAWRRPEPHRRAASSDNPGPCLEVTHPGGKALCDVVTGEAHGGLKRGFRSYTQVY